MSASRPPFFPPAYPDPTTLYNDLPQDVRDQWVGWAKANPVGYLDYKNELRATQDAYEFITTQLMSANGGVQPTTYPPGDVDPPSKNLITSYASAVESDMIGFSLARTLDEDSTWLVYATAPAATPSDINSKNNLFVGVFRLPAGTPLRSWSQDIGASYVSQFGSLAGLSGQTVVFWVFSFDMGSLRYLGGWTVTVGILSPLATLAYWPLNEAVGTRTSIAQPQNLVPYGNPTQVAGIIDNAILFTGANGDGLQGPNPTPFNTANTAFTVAAWFKATAYAGRARMLDNGSGNESGTDGWNFAVDGGLTRAYLQFQSSLGGSVVRTPITMPLAAGTWYHIAANYDPLTTTANIYLDGGNKITNAAMGIYDAPTRSLRMGETPGAITAQIFAVSDVALWSRVLSDAEITSLYNAGAGFRYPYLP
jgi:Concanavalin A-like lectin/glucanases superfamily